MAQEDSSVKRDGAYVSYKTFANFINYLREHGVPSVIDKSLMTKMSGSMQSALIISLRYLKLIDASDQATPALHAIAEAPLDSPEFRNSLADVLTQAYEFLSDGSIDLSKATSKQLENKFRDAGYQGSTLDKCMTFFLAAAKAADLNMSPHLLKGRVRAASSSSSRRTPTKRKATKKADRKQGNDENPPPSLPNGKKLEVPLPSGDTAVIVLPNNLSAADWIMLETIFKTFAERIVKEGESE